MKAPDTIYIPIVEEDGEKLLCATWWETDTSYRNASVNETIPYIRKDALLEWAKEQKKATEELIKGHPKDDSLWAEMHWYEQLIKHIESL